MTAEPVAVAPTEQVRLAVTDDPASAVATNRRRAMTLAVLPGVVLLVIGAVVGAAAGALVVGVVVGAALGVVAVVGLRRAAPGIVLRGLRAEPIDEDDVPGIATLVEGLCATLGLTQPTLYSVDERMPNALAVGRGSSDAALVCTTGLIDGGLDPVVLEGVLAHELTHVKRDDVAPATIAAALVLSVGRVVPVGGAGMVHRIAGRGREFATDRQAIRATRYPPGLRQALAALWEAPPSGSGGIVVRRAGQVTRWLWTSVLPDAQGMRPSGAEMVGELDLPSVRIAALDEW
ncbi:MAG TPA: M48 family metalloprotease [Acidimicrobiales bacterium]|nr:M48 family metalloprotease [Acidimicrobiales bacterium]